MLQNSRFVDACHLADQYVDQNHGSKFRRHVPDTCNNIMIDTLTVTIPYHGRPVLRQLAHKDISDLVWTVRYVTGQQIEQNGTSIRVTGLGGELYLQGSFIKFLCGQNAFGNCDIPWLISEVVDKLLLLDVIDNCPILIKSLNEEKFEIKRLDITTYIQLPKDLAPYQFYKNLQLRSKMERLGHPTRFKEKVESVGWGFGSSKRASGSRRWTLKFYDKLSEMRQGRNCFFCFDDVSINDWLKDKVRIEYCLKSPELKRLNLNNFSIDSEDEYRVALAERNGRITMFENSIDVMEINRQLSKRHREYFLAWVAGEDTSFSAMPRASYFRAKDKFRALGVDITKSFEEASQCEANVASTHNQYYVTK